MGKRGAAAKQAGKVLERYVATILDTHRYPADVGGSVDVENGDYVVQCKHVGRISLSAIEGLAVQADRDGAQRSKLGLVAVKRRAGGGRETPVLFILTEASFRLLSERAHGQRPEPESALG